MRIFYFTGTGNSLWIAKEIAKVFGAELTAIQNYDNEKVNDEAIGLAFPIYMGDAPWYVKRFLLHLKGNAKYVFVVSTFNGSDRITPKNIDKALCKNGMKLSYYQNIVMPGNCIQSSKAENERRLINASAQIKSIIKDIENQKTNYTSDGKFPEKDYVESSYFYSRMNIMKFFRITSKCTGCGLCANLCPTGNIEIVNGKARLSIRGKRIVQPAINVFIFVHRMLLSCLYLFVQTAFSTSILKLK